MPAMNQLVLGDGEKAPEFHYFHSLKQGLFLEHGGSATAMSMELGEQQQLWESVRLVDAGSFHSVDRRLRLSRPQSVPVRITTAGTSVHQPLVQIDDSSTISIRAVLVKLFNSNLFGGGSNEPHVICHGVPIDLDAPLVEVWATLAHPDHFLYLVVVLES